MEANDSCGENQLQTPLPFKKAFRRKDRRPPEPFKSRLVKELEARRGRLNAEVALADERPGQRTRVQRGWLLGAQKGLMASHRPRAQKLP